jgi:hypothetical protein
MEKAILWALSIVVGGFVGYLSGYTKKKGENRAVREDFDNLLIQVKETTRVTKEIENKLSDAAWDRQKRWELMRDVLIEIARKTAAVKDTLLELGVAYAPSNTGEDEESSRRTAKKVEVYPPWNRAANDLDAIVAIANLACSPEVVAALTEFTRYARELSVEIIGKKSNVFATKARELAAKHVALNRAMRKEIANDPKPMSPSDAYVGAQDPAFPVANPTPPLA